MRLMFMPVFALLFSVALLIVGSGLLGLLVPVRAGIESFSTFVIGLMAAAYFSGFVVGCLVTPTILRRVGHIRSFAVLAAIAASVSLLYGMVVDPLLWGIFRAVTGLCLAGLYMIVESWLNEKTTNEARGTVFSVYMAVNLGAVTVGQVVLAAVDPTSMMSFALVCIFFCLSLVPVSMTVSPAPAPIARIHVRLGWLYRLSPVGFVGCLSVGLANGAFWGMAPVYAQDKLIDAKGVALFMGAAVVGGALAQWPLGRLSDRTDRRRVIAGTCFAVVFFAGTMIAAGQVVPNLLPALAVFLGAVLFPMYSLCVAHANDNAPTDAFVDVSVGLLLCYGASAVAGPVIASALMHVAGDDGLLFVLMGVYIGMGTYVLWRISQRPPVPEEERAAFVASPRTTPASAALDPRADEEEGEAGFLEPDTPPVQAGEDAPAR